MRIDQGVQWGFLVLEYDHGILLWWWFGPFGVDCGLVEDAFELLGVQVVLHYAWGVDF